MIKKITRKNMRAFLSRHATAERVLDLGAGGSPFANLFPNRVTADIDPERKPDIVADAEHLPFKDNEFKCILCTEMFEHVKDPFQAEQEIRRVMAPGGKLILTTRFVFPLHDTPEDYWRFSKYGLAELFRAWKIIEILPETKDFSAIGALLQRISFQTALRLNKLSKLIILVLAWIFDHLNWLIVKEYGDIKRRNSEADIMATGYYLVCRKND